MGTDRIATFMNSSGYKYKTGNWSYTSSVTSVLSNIVYLGHIKFKAMVIENAHDPIITKELWDQVKSTREERHKKFGSSFKRGEMLLSGFLRCGVCGSRFYSHSVNKITQYYSCYSVGKSSPKMSKSTNCKAKRWRVEILEAMVDYEIRLLCFDNSYFDKLLKTSKPRNKSVDSNKKYIDTRIIEIDKQINKLMDLYQSDTIPMDVVSSRIDTLHQEKLLLVDQLKSLPTENDEDNLTDGVAELLSNTSTLWDMADLEQKRFLLSALIRQIVVFDDHIEIDWTFLPEREKATD